MATVGKPSITNLYQQNFHHQQGNSHNGSYNYLNGYGNRPLEELSIVSLQEAHLSSMNSVPDGSSTIGFSESISDFDTSSATIGAVDQAEAHMDQLDLNSHHQALASVPISSQQYYGNFNIIGAPRMQMQLTKLLELFLEAECLEWAMMICLVLRDIEVVARLVSRFTDRSYVPENKIKRLAAIVLAIEKWAYEECEGYRHFFMKIRNDNPQLDQALKMSGIPNLSNIDPNHPNYHHNLHTDQQLYDINNGNYQDLIQDNYHQQTNETYQNIQHQRSRRMQQQNMQYNPGMNAMAGPNSMHYADLGGHQNPSMTSSHRGGLSNRNQPYGSHFHGGGSASVCGSTRGAKQHRHNQKSPTMSEQAISTRQNFEDKNKVKDHKPMQKSSTSPKTVSPNQNLSSNPYKDQNSPGTQHSDGFILSSLSSPLSQLTKPAQNTTSIHKQQTYGQYPSHTTSPQHNVNYYGKQASHPPQASRHNPNPRKSLAPGMSHMVPTNESAMSSVPSNLQNSRSQMENNFSNQATPTNIRSSRSKSTYLGGKDNMTPSPAELQKLNEHQNSRNMHHPNNYNSGDYNNRRNSVAEAVGHSEEVYGDQGQCSVQ